MSAPASPTADAPAPTTPRGPSRAARGWALALLALGAAGAGIPSPLYPAYQAQLGFSDVTMTAVYAVYPLVGVPAVFLLGSLGDRLSPRRVMRGGIVVAAAGSVALALAPSTGWLVAGRIAYGIALAVVTGAGVAVATSGADKVRAGTVSAVVFMLGTGAGPVLGGALGRFGPAPGLVPFGVTVVLLGAVFVGLGSVRDPDPGPSTGAGSPDGSPTRAARRALVVAAVNGFLGWAVVGLVLGLISSVADRFLGLSDPLVAGGLAGALLVWSTLTVPAVARLGPRRAQLVGLAALAVSVVVLALGVDSPVAVVAACLLAGPANGLLYGAATTTVSTTASPERASRTAAAVYSAFYLGAGLPALLVGLLTVVLPLDAALSAIAAATLVPTVVMIALMARTTTPPCRSGWCRWRRARGAATAGGRARPRRCARPTARAGRRTAAGR
jgi:MFS family permease